MSLGIPRLGQASSGFGLGSSGEQRGNGEIASHGSVELLRQKVIHQQGFLSTVYDPTGVGGGVGACRGNHNSMLLAS